MNGGNIRMNILLNPPNHRVVKSMPKIHHVVMPSNLKYSLEKMLVWEYLNGQWIEYCTRSKCERSPGIAAAFNTSQNWTWNSLWLFISITCFCWFSVVRKQFRENLSYQLKFCSFRSFFFGGKMLSNISLIFFLAETF